MRYSLTDLYDADRRTKDATARRLATGGLIPHPLINVQYADAISICTHAKRHRPGQFCPGRVRLPDGTLAPRREQVNADDPLPSGGDIDRRVLDRVYRRSATPTGKYAQNLGTIRVRAVLQNLRHQSPEEIAR